MDKFTSKHIGFVLMGLAIVSLKTYPTIITRNGMRDSWVSVIIASILIFGYLGFVLMVCRKTNCFDIKKIYYGAFGKVFGGFLLGLFIFSLVITMIESASVEGNSMHSNMLIETPVWFFIIFFVLTGLYTVKKNKVAIITVTIIGITLIVIAGINLAMLTARYKKFSYLFPVFEHGIDKGFIASIIQILGLYGCVSIALPYFKDITDKNKVVSRLLIALFVIVQMEIVAISGVIMTFDINRLNEMAYPKLLQTQLISYLRFLESGEFYVMLQINGGWFMKFILTFYAILLMLKNTIFDKKYIVYPISIVVYILSCIVGQNLYSLFKLLDYYTYFCFVNFIVLPTLVFMVYLIRNRKNIQGSADS